MFSMECASIVDKRVTDLVILDVPQGRMHCLSPKFIKLLKRPHGVSLTDYLGGQIRIRIRETSRRVFNPRTRIRFRQRARSVSTRTVVHWYYIRIQWASNPAACTAGNRWRHDTGRAGRSPESCTITSYCKLFYFY